MDPWFNICRQLEEELPKLQEINEEVPLNKILQELNNLCDYYRLTPQFNPRFFDDLMQVDSQYLIEWLSLLPIQNRTPEGVQSLVDEILAFQKSFKASKLLVLFFLTVFSTNKKGDLKDTILELVAKLGKKLGSPQEVNQKLLSMFSHVVYSFYPIVLNVKHLENSIYNGKNTKGFEFVKALINYEGFEIDQSEAILQELETFFFCTH